MDKGRRFHQLLVKLARANLERDQAIKQANQERVQRDQANQERDRAIKQAARATKRAREEKERADRVEREKYEVPLHSRLVVRLENPAAEGTPVQELLAAIVRLANCYSSIPKINEVLRKVGLRPEYLRAKATEVHFQDPNKAFKKYAANQRYAFSWILPNLKHSVFFDVGFRKRFIALSKMEGQAAIFEMSLIIVLLTIKLFHEECHQGIRDSNPQLLVDGLTPSHINGGESGNFYEKHANGGVAGFVYKGKRWNGNQRIVCIHLDGVAVTDKYVETVCMESRKEKPDLSKFWPIELSGSRYNAKRGEHIMSSPSQQAQARFEAELNAQHGEIALGGGCRMVPGDRCGLRFLRILPPPTKLDFSGAGACAVGATGVRRSVSAELRDTSPAACSAIDGGGCYNDRQDSGRQLRRRSNLRVDRGVAGVMPAAAADAGADLPPPAAIFAQKRRSCRRDNNVPSELRPAKRPRK